MKKRILLLISIFVIWFLVGPSIRDSAFAAELNWVGCGISKKAYIGNMAEAYEKETGVKIILEGGGATRGIRDVAAGKADMGGSCRHVLLVPEERDVKLVHVAWDALVVITNPSNPVKDISSANVKAVFEGKITNWKELGGEDLPIKVVIRKGKISGVGLMARELLFKDADRDFTSNAVQLKSSGPVEKLVEVEKTAIAITGVSSAKKRNVDMLSINGKKPTPENIASGEYILYRPLYLVTSKTPTAEVEKFIDFVKSEKGQQIISDSGTVNLKQGAKLWQPYRKAMKEVSRKNR